MQFFTEISRNTVAIRCYHCLSLFGNSEIMHCGIVIYMPYYSYNLKAFSVIEYIIGDPMFYIKSS